MKNRIITSVLLIIMMITTLIPMTAFAEEGKGDMDTLINFIVKYGTEGSMLSSDPANQNQNDYWIDNNEDGLISYEEAEMAVWYMQDFGYPSVYLTTVNGNYLLTLTNELNEGTVTVNENGQTDNTNSSDESNKEQIASVDEIYNKAIEENPSIQNIDKEIVIDYITRNINSESESKIIEDLYKMADEIERVNQENLIDFKDEYQLTEKRYSKMNKLFEYGSYKFMLLLDPPSEVEIIDYLNFGKPYAPEFQISKEEYRAAPYMNLTIISSPLENWDLGPVFKLDGTVDRNAIDVIKDLDYTKIIESAENLLPETDFSEEDIIDLIENEKSNDISESINESVNDDEISNVENTVDLTDDSTGNSTIEVDVEDLEDTLKDIINESNIVDIIAAIENNEDITIISGNETIVIENGIITIIENKTNEDILNVFKTIKDKLNNEYGIEIVTDGDDIVPKMNITSKTGESLIIDSTGDDSKQIMVISKSIEQPKYTQRIVEVVVVDSNSKENIETIGTITFDNIQSISVTGLDKQMTSHISWGVYLMGLLFLIIVIAITYMILRKKETK